MASKSIDIKIASHFNADGVLEANKGLAKLAQDVKGVNDEMRKATMRAEMSVNSYAEQADKAVKAMGGGYKTLGDQLAELTAYHGKTGEAATEAGKAMTTAAAAGTKSFVSLEMIIGLCKGSTEQLVKAFGGLAGKFPIISKIGVGALGAFVAAGASVIKFLTSVKDLVVTAFNLNAVSKDVSEMSAKFIDLNNAAESFASKMADARKESERQAKIYEEQANALNKVVKAQNDLKRAQELSLAVTQEQKDEINRRYDSMNAAADDESAQSVRDNRRSELRKEEGRIIAEIKNAEKSRDKYKTMFGKGNGSEDAALEQQAIADEKRKELEVTRHKISLIDQEDEAAAASIEARKLKEETAAVEAEEKAAREQDKRAKEMVKAAKEAVEKRMAEEEKAYAEEMRYIEAEQKAREKMEAELHKQRIDNLKDEVSASQSAASAKQGTISAAQTEFDKAFAMYRSEDKGAAQIAEERDYAKDYKQLQKDASRYGGKWRIDELSSLIAAGDTKGQQAKLEEWRKSSKFTPEVESMVRAAAADQTRTTAEDELRKISNNTEGLAKKLDELLQVK